MAIGDILASQALNKEDAKLICQLAPSMNWASALLGE
jgi:hypothetical protein